MKSLLLIQQSQCLGWKQDNLRCVGTSAPKCVHPAAFPGPALLPAAEERTFLFEQEQAQRSPWALAGLDASGGGWHSLPSSGWCSLSPGHPRPPSCPPPAVTAPSAGLRAVSQPAPHLLARPPGFSWLHLPMGNARVPFDWGRGLFLFLFLFNSNPHHFSSWIHCELSYKKSFLWFFWFLVFFGRHAHSPISSERCPPMWSPCEQCATGVQCFHLRRCSRVPEPLESVGELALVLITSVKTVLSFWYIPLFNLV